MFAASPVLPILPRRGLTSYLTASVASETILAALRGKKTREEADG